MIRKIQGFLEKYGDKHGIVFIFSLVVLFWTVFDSIITYVTPLLIEEHGFSLSMIGFIIGASSIVGALFDFFVSKFFKNTDYKRMFLIMFALCALYPFLLWQAKTIWAFLFAMAVWGVYFDLYGFGTFNFISRYTKEENNSAGFGVIETFRALGTIIASLVVGLVVIDHVNWAVFSLGWISLGVGFTFFLLLLVLIRKYYPESQTVVTYPRKKNFLVELHLWRKIGASMSPVLLLTFFLFFTEAFFWTLAPLYAETISTKMFGGLFLTAYTLPTVIVGLFVGFFTRRFGKKRTAFTSVLIGSLILIPFVYLSNSNSVVLILSVFVASFFMGVALPAINSSYADYISKTPKVEGEIEGLEDFAFNLGYLLGPISAGVFADIFDIPTAFSVLGILGVILASLLLIFAPKHINIHTEPSEL